MKWFSRIFRTRIERPNPIALDLPNDPGATHVHRPGTRGRTKNQQAEDLAQYERDMRAKGRAISERDQANSDLVGATHYICRTSRDGAVCRTCAKKEGKKFAWRDTRHGRPGDSGQCQGGYCRCYAEPIVPTTF